MIQERKTQAEIQEQNIQTWKKAGSYAQEPRPSNSPVTPERSETLEEKTEAEQQRKEALTQRY